MGKRSQSRFTSLQPCDDLAYAVSSDENIPRKLNSTPHRHAHSCIMPGMTTSCYTPTGWGVLDQAVQVGGASNITRSGPACHHALAAGHPPPKPAKAVSEAQGLRCGQGVGEQ